MKKCPSCGRTYADDALNFCLQDGTVLEQETVSTFGNEETVFLGNAPRTDANRFPSGSQSNQPPPTWNASPYGGSPVKRKSRAWIWILLSVLFVGLIGVAGAFGFLVYLGMKMEQEEANNRAAANANANKPRWSANSNIKVNTSPGTDRKADFSQWKTGNLDYAKISYRDGDLTVASLKSDYYCVIAASKEFTSNDQISKVTVKNTTGDATSLGFGLMIHSSPTKALLKDYSFLIRTDGTPSYRIVQHDNSKEKDLIKWTASSAIEGGTSENELKVVDEGTRLAFYINDELVNTIDDKLGDSSGIAGIYAANAVPIAFSDLAIEKAK